VLELEVAVGLGKGLGDVSRAVIAHHLAAVDALAVEPGHDPAQEADCRCLLLVSENLYAGEPCGVVDGHVGPVATDNSGAPLLSITGDAVTHLAKAGQLLDVDVDQVARRLAPITLHHRFGLQVPQPAQAPGLIQSSDASRFRLLSRHRQQCRDVMHHRLQALPD
jgi:hypothetical protein